MDNQSSRFVDYQQIVVLKQDIQRDVFRIDLRFARRWLLQLEDLTRFDVLTWAGRFTAVDGDASVANQALDCAAREPRPSLG